MLLSTEEAGHLIQCPSCCPALFLYQNRQTKTRLKMGTPQFLLHPWKKAVRQADLTPKCHQILHSGPLSPKIIQLTTVCMSAYMCLSHRCEFTLASDTNYILLRYVKCEKQLYVYMRHWPGQSWSFVYVNQSLKFTQLTQTINLTNELKEWRHVGQSESFIYTSESSTYSLHLLLLEGNVFTKVIHH